MKRQGVNMIYKITNEKIEKVSEAQEGFVTISKREILANNSNFIVEISGEKLNSDNETNARFAVIARNFGMGLIRNNIHLGAVIITLISGDETEFENLLDKADASYDKESGAELIEKTKEQIKSGYNISREIS